MSSQTLRTSSKNSGFTAIELAIVLVVIGVIAVLALRGFGLVNKSKGTVEGQNIIDTTNAVQICFSKATDFTALGASATTGTTYVLTNCSVEVANPPSSATATDITNQFGGVRTVARASINTGTNNAIVVTNSAIPRDMCSDVIQTIWDTATLISITPTGGATATLKTSYDQRYAPTAIALCKSADTATIIVTRAKNG